MATETAQQSVPPDVSEHLTTDDRVALLRAMLLMRGIEERAMKLYRQGKVPGSFYDGFGQEAVSVGATFAMGAATACASCTATWRRTSSAASTRRGSSPSTWAARAASRAGATATCTSATARSAASGWSRCCPT